MRRKTWIATLAVAALATLAGSSHAVRSAIGGNFSRVTVQGQTVESTGVTCKPGKRVLSAGFQSVDFAPESNGAAIVRTTVRRNGKRSVAAEATNFAQTAGDFVLYAYCGLGRNAITARSAQIEIDPGELGTITLSCDPGSEAVAGGFESVGFDPANGPRIVTLTSMRVGARQWRLVGGNLAFGSDAPGTYAGYVYCQSPPRRLITRSADADTGPGGLETVDLRCPAGSKPFSGGFDGHPVRQGGFFSGAGAITSRRINRGRTWRTVATNAGNQIPGELTAYTYCRRKRR